MNRRALFASITAAILGRRLPRRLQSATWLYWTPDGDLLLTITPEVVEVAGSLVELEARLVSDGWIRSAPLKIGHTIRIGDTIRIEPPARFRPQL